LQRGRLEQKPFPREEQMISDKPMLICCFIDTHTHIYILCINYIIYIILLLRLLLLLLYIYTYLIYIYIYIICWFHVHPCTQMPTARFSPLVLQGGENWIHWMMMVGALMIFDEWLWIDNNGSNMIKRWNTIFNSYPYTTMVHINVHIISNSYPYPWTHFQSWSIHIHISYPMMDPIWTVINSLRTMACSQFHAVTCQRARLHSVAMQWEASSDFPMSRSWTPKQHSVNTSLELIWIDWT
jgi:hypothetical protein